MADPGKSLINFFALTMSDLSHEYPAHHEPRRAEDHEEGGWDEALEPVLLLPY